MNRMRLQRPVLTFRWRYLPLVRWGQPSITTAKWLDNSFTHSEAHCDNLFAICVYTWPIGGEELVVANHKVTAACNIFTSIEFYTIVRLIIWPGAAHLYLHGYFGCMVFTLRYPGVNQTWREEGLYSSFIFILPIFYHFISFLFIFYPTKLIPLPFIFFFFLLFSVHAFILLRYYYFNFSSSFFFCLSMNYNEVKLG